jgi:hypothetical protein
MTDRISLTTRADCDELLSTYTIEEVRQLWENGAFVTPLNKEVLDYFVQRIMGIAE